MVRLAVVLSTPETETPQVLHALRLLASRTGVERGCLACRVWTDEGDGALVRYIEEWATEETMRQRVQSEPFTRLLEVLEAAVEAPSIQFDFVTRTRGLDYIEEVRNVDRLRGIPLHAPARDRDGSAKRRGPHD